MDDLPSDYTPIKTRNNKRIILIVVIVAIISFAAYFSYQSKYIDDSSKELHATLTKDISMSGGTISATLLNDGTKTWNVTSINISDAIPNCNRLPHNVKVNETASVRCSTSGADAGKSYNIIITLTDVEDTTKKFLISGITEN